jgi:hypothetical protein
MGLVRAETAFEGNNNKGPLEAGGAHAGPQAPRLLQGKERREDSPCLCVCVSDSPKDCRSYLNKSTPRHCIRSTPHHHNIQPFVRSDRKPEPSCYPALAAFDIKVDRKSRFPVLLLAVATVCRTIANARLRSELTKGCKSHQIAATTLCSASATSATLAIWAG